MDVFLLILRLALAAVFLVAATTKLTDRAGTRRAIGEFGTPDPVAGPAALGLPIAELAVTGCLLVPGAVRYGAFGALALLGVFCAAIGVNLAKGRTPDCHCFGQLHSEPVGAKTLARNGVLAAGAVLVLSLGWSDPGPSAVAWIAGLDATGALALALGVAALAVLAVGGWVAVHLLRQHGRLLLRLERLESALAGAGIEVDADEGYTLPEAGLPVGRTAPGFVVPAVAGGTLGLTALLEGERPALLVFTDPGCGPCQALMPEVARWQREHADEVTIAVLSSGDRDETRAKAEEHGLARVLVDPGRSVSAAFEAHGTPAAVLVAPDGTVASPVAQGSDAIERLLDVAIAWEPPVEPGLAIGEQAPALALADLDGAETALAEALDPERETLVVFWNPGCGFCRRMHEDLRAYEHAAPAGAPAVLVVSAGGVDEVRAEGFRRVLLDPDFGAAGAFGATGTPMGLLIGVDGRVASRLAAGADAVLALARPLAAAS
jgi:thiol-disulfide isomerase/thioredoxin/uncharacterized membrane protein YphA (DoxX/SURF4 family)